MSPTIQQLNSFFRQEELPPDVVQEIQTAFYAPWSEFSQALSIANWRHGQLADFDAPPDKELALQYGFNIVGDKLMPYQLDDRFMALSYHLHVVAEKIHGMPEEMKYVTAAVLIALILIINSFSITLRVFLRSRKKW